MHFFLMFEHRYLPFRFIEAIDVGYVYIDISIIDVRKKLLITNQHRCWSQCLENAVLSYQLTIDNENRINKDIRIRSMLRPGVPKLFKWRCPFSSRI